jgi:hypothetical protein
VVNASSLYATLYHANIGRVATQGLVGENGSGR